LIKFNKFLFFDRLNFILHNKYNVNKKNDVKIKLKLLFKIKKI